MEVSQTKDELLTHLREQMHFLRVSSREFDNGHYIEAKRLATTIRVLVHDTGRSNSLLQTLGLKTSIRFGHVISHDPNRAKAIAYMGVGMEQGPNGMKYVPNLDEIVYFSDFDEWWNGLLIVNHVQGIQFTRKDIVLNIANKDGGSHVDPNLPFAYSELSRNNGFGWRSGDTSNNPFGNSPELAAVRQITHELDRTIQTELKL